MASDDSFSFSVRHDIRTHHHIGEPGYQINGHCEICNRPPPPPTCDECGRTGPDIDIKQTQEADAVWGEGMEDEIWWDDEWHCADCRKKLDKEPIQE